jgi:hypothetical protein
MDVMMMVAVRFHKESKREANSNPSRCQIWSHATSMRDARFKIQDAGYSMVDAGCEMQNSKFKIQNSKI